MTNYKLSDTKELQVTWESTADIINGVLLILKYQPGQYFEAEPSIIYFGYYDLEQITQEELQKMNDWGWFEQDNCWCHSV